MKASDLFIQALENEGVEYIFGIPGEENLDILESLRKSKKIKLVLTRHEQGAAFMAATYGRLTGKAGVCLATLGPARQIYDACSLRISWGLPPGDDYWAKTYKEVETRPVSDSGCCSIICAHL